MKRYGDFITSEEELAFLGTVRNYVEKEIMPVRMQLDEDYAAFEKAYMGLVKLGWGEGNWAASISSRAIIRI